MSIKLKLCPFCGSEELRTGLDNIEDKFIECESCGIYIERRLKSELIDAWNKRPNEKGGLVDELVGALEMADSVFKNLCEYIAGKPVVPDAKAVDVCMGKLRQALARAKGGAE